MAVLSAESLALSSDFAPIIISFPDLKTKTVLFGSTFLIITAGNLFGLYLELSDFSAIRIMSKQSMLSLASATTFWISGNDSIVLASCLSDFEAFKGLFGL